MLNYVKGAIFIIAYISFLYVFGSALIPKTKSAPKRFVVGYIFFAALLAIVGIPIQLLNLSWNMFFIYFLILSLSILIFSVYRIYTKKICLFNGDLYDFVKKYWFLFFLASILVLISTVKIGWYWMNNCLDDGYYLNRIATLPYIDHPFAVVPGTGLLGNVSLSNSYNYNIFELEASVYIYILRIIPTFFARGCLSYVNYFLFACVSYCFFEKVNDQLEVEIKLDQNMLQYLTIFIMIFSFNYDLSKLYNLHQLQDGWQNATAMYYGSSIVRSMGLVMLLTPFIGKEKIKFKDCFWFGITSLVLMSKSSIALPLIFVSAICICFIIFINQKKMWIFLFALIVLLMGVGYLIGDNIGIANTYRNQFISNSKSIIIAISFIIIFINLFFKCKSVMLEICGYILLLFGLTLIEPINNLFEKLSMYDFVACRFLTGVFTFVIMFAVFCLVMILKKIIVSRKIKYYFYSIFMFGASLIFFFVSIFAQVNYSMNKLTDTVEIFLRNKYFVPQSIVFLGDCLEQLSKEKNEKLYAIMPEGIGVEGITYSLAISIRQLSPSTVSLSAYNRYPGSIEPEFANYSADNQRIFDEFISYRSTETLKNFEKMLNEYPINCVVTLNCVDQEMQKIGMKKYTGISYQNSYYIYYR